MSWWETFSVAQCILLGQLTTYVKKNKNEKDKLKYIPKVIEHNAEDHFYDVRLEGFPKQDKSTNHKGK